MPFLYFGNSFHAGRNRVDGGPPVSFTPSSRHPLGGLLLLALWEMGTGQQAREALMSQA